MSNVLLGVIGVALFIGLALAGALILGDDFTTASSSTKAAALVQLGAQVSAAASMYQVKTGTSFYGDPIDLVPRFLRTEPSHPSIKEQYVMEDAVTIGGVAQDRTVYYQFLGGGEDAMKLCRAINLQLNGSEAVPSAAIGMSGCAVRRGPIYRAYAVL